MEVVSGYPPLVSWLLHDGLTTKSFAGLEVLVPAAMPSLAGDGMRCPRGSTAKLELFGSPFSHTQHSDQEDK